MHCKIDGQRTGLRIEMAGRVVACHITLAFDTYRHAPFVQRGQQQLARVRIGEEELHVVIEAPAGKAGKRLTVQRDAHEGGRQGLGAPYLQAAKAQFVAHTFRAQGLGGWEGIDGVHAMKDE